MMEGRIDWHFAELFIGTAEPPPVRGEDTPSPVMAAVVLLCLALGGLTSLCIMAAT